MVVKKDPENVPEDFLDFEDLFEDINSPGIWIAKSETDLVERAITLDGHSSALIYSTSAEDLKWDALSERGAYSYKPNAIGDGIIFFPHTFYFEIPLKLERYNVILKASFDGNGIKAIIMPMKDVEIGNFRNVLTQRLSKTFENVLASESDQIKFEEGKELKLSENIKSNLGLKLALIGIKLENLTVKKLELISTVEDKSKVLGGVSEKSMKEVEEEIVSTPIIETKPAPAPAIPRTKIVEEKTTKSVIPPLPSSPGKAKRKVDDAKKSVSKPVTQKLPEMSKKEISVEEEGVTTAEAAIRIPVSKTKKKSRTLADVGSITEDFSETTYRNTEAIYFERMLPRKTYPLQVTVTSEKIKSKKSTTSVTSGEKVSQVKSEMQIDSSENFVKVRPDIPGSIVIPNSIDVDIRKENAEALFYVTPLSTGKLDAKINFIQKNEIISTLAIPTKVITHRISRITGYIGLIFSFLPPILAFLWNETPSQFINSRFNSLIPTLSGFGTTIILSIGIGLIVISGLLYIIIRPKSNNTSLPLSL